MAGIGAIIAEFFLEILEAFTLEEEVLIELETIQESMAEQVDQDISEGVSQEDAIGKQYKAVDDIEPEVANQWSDKLEDEGYKINYQVGSDNDSGPVFGDDPDEPLTPEEEENEFDDTDDHVIRQNKFKYWMSRVASAAGGLGWTGAIIFIFLGFFLFNFLYKGACTLIRTIFEKRSSSCAKTNSKWKCSAQSCTTPVCTDANKFRKWLIKYRIYAYVFMTLLGVIYIAVTKGRGFIGGIGIALFGNLLVWLMIGPVGYILVNAVCGFSDLTKVL